MLSGVLEYSFRRPRCAASSRARDCPPGRPRPPILRFRLINSQVSRLAPATSPERWAGQRPLAAWCASAQARIRSTVSGARSPRRSASKPFRVVPPGRPRRPTPSAEWTAPQVSGCGASRTGPVSRVGHSPVAT
jgi:hypothetical protein